jgi:hypothetical protein
LESFAKFACIFQFWSIEDKHKENFTLGPNNLSALISSTNIYWSIGIYETKVAEKEVFFGH